MLLACTDWMRKVWPVGLESRDEIACTKKGGFLSRVLSSGPTEGGGTRPLAVFKAAPRLRFYFRGTRETASLIKMI